MTVADEKFIRKVNLIVIQGTKGLDLSDMRFVFQVMQGDTESPNNASIRVYNLADSTVKQIRGEYTQVIVQAGYENGAYGVIFQGTIKQFRIGRESPTDTFLDILAADGDIGYNFGVISRTLPPGTTAKDRIIAAAQAMNLDIDPSQLPDFSNPLSNSPALARSRVAFGMARSMMRSTVQSIGATWSIQNGKVQVIPLKGYLPGEAVSLNAATGMIGIPEQTELGIRVRSLLNPNFKVGGLLRLNNKDIIQLIQRDPISAPMPFNQYTGIAYAATIANGADGLYRIYVVDHFGGPREHEFYSDLICLAINQSSSAVLANN